MRESSAIEEKIKQITREMKELGLWQNITPDWLKEFEKKCFTGARDFSAVLQAKQFLADDIQKGKLLQLLIELDAVI